MLIIVSYMDVRSWFSKGQRSKFSSHDELNKAVVLTDVTFENVLTRTEDALETGTIQFDTL